MAQRLALLCSVIYLSGYLSRVNFAAVTVAILSETGWEKTAISSVTTALFIFYGIGQIISGWLGDRFPPERIVSTGLLTSAVMNLIIPHCSSIPQMTVVWAVNGLAQAMLWPPIVRILSAGCHKKEYQSATVVVSWGSSLGTILVFLLASASTATIGWRPVFRIGAAAAVGALILWIVVYSKIEAYSNSEKNLSSEHPGERDPQNGAPEGVRTKMPRALLTTLCAIFMAVVILGALRDSISAWLPNYIAETFALSSSSALLTSVIMPIFTTLTYPVVLSYYRRFFSSELNCAATIYALSALASLLLFFFSDINPIISVLLLSLISACMHGANFLIIGLVPKKFDKFGNVATISGLINSFVYAGSSLSIWGIAAIAQSSGWLATIIVWGVLALAGAIICFSVSRKFQTFFT